MRRAARTDANHAEIVAALRGVGATVQDMARLGQGCPDLLVAFRRRTVVMEVKVKGGYLTPMENEWLHQWQGVVFIVHSPDEALRAIGAIQ